MTIGGGFSTNQGASYTRYDGFKDITESFSSSNTHTGAVCRKYVREYNNGHAEWEGAKDTITVTLFVYRMSPDGTMTGESMTCNISKKDAQQGDGVVYRGVK